MNEKKHSDKVLNVASKKRQQTAKKIIQAIKESKGFLTMAASRAGVSYKTVCRYVRDFPSVREAVEEARASMKDFAEGKLFKAIDEGNITAIIFYLKTQAKDRGYSEKIETEQKIEHKGELAIKTIKVDPEIAKKVADEIAKQDTDTE
ncbi:MAG: hypothetical protein ACXQTR_02625 [Candidatus Methanospirareceae archaeon]